MKTNTLLKIVTIQSSEAVWVFQILEQDDRFRGERFSSLEYRGSILPVVSCDRVEIIDSRIWLRGEDKSLDNEWGFVAEIGLDTVLKALDDWAHNWEGFNAKQQEMKPGDMVFVRDYDSQIWNKCELIALVSKPNSPIRAVAWTSKCDRVLSWNQVKPITPQRTVNRTEEVLLESPVKVTQYTWTETIESELTE